jgi:hypothetical protein
MAFTLEPVSRPPWRKARQRISFEIARERMVANLRAEFARFNQQGRDTRHIKKLSPAETVFIFYYGREQAIQAKVTCGPRQTLEREAGGLFTAVLKGVIDKLFRRAYKIGTAHLAAARVRRSNKRG